MCIVFSVTCFSSCVILCHMLSTLLHLFLFIVLCFFFFFFKQKTAYEMRISDWSSDVCSSDLRAASAITTCLRQIERFHDNALPGKSGVAVHQNRQHLQTLLIAPTILAGTYTALANGIDDFKVRRVERQGQVHRTATSGQIAGEAVVVFDVTTR